MAPIKFDYLASELQDALSTKPQRDKATPLPVPAVDSETDDADEEIA